jgi:hypothetical protein
MRSKPVSHRVIGSVFCPVGKEQVERQAVSHSAERELCVVAQGTPGIFDCDMDSIRYND